ncbi:hypothetical protein RRG08_054325 [Elysia crispata]|uniref:Uncharacterized protein n=1 Tax=Elysia crispata TaxID=231223 RepID=A0AAE1B5G4_9GAST|nr:hypothetical protein RRG08_054325 [Elysia crispata]
MCLRRRSSRGLEKLLSLDPCHTLRCLPSFLNLDIRKTLPVSPSRLFFLVRLPITFLLPFCSLYPGHTLKHSCLDPELDYRLHLTVSSTVPSHRLRAEKGTKGSR